MLRIGLDLSTRTCGLAILEGGKLTYDSYQSKEKDYLKLQVEIVDWIFNKINWSIQQPHNLIIEDIYMGLDPYSTIDTARTQGAVIDRYFKITKKFPIFVSAISARKTLGWEANLSKAEYQLYVIEKWGIEGMLPETKGEIIRIGNHWVIEYKRLSENKKNASKVLKEKLNKDIRELNKITKNSLNKLSTKLTKETNLTQHSSDAIILVMADEKQTNQN